MELVLQGDLPHQTLPVNAIADVFSDVPSESAEHYSNPVFDLTSPKLRNNILTIKADPKHNLPFSQRGRASLDSPLGLDIRMETGTGKTYVYARTIFELHRRYGVSKFILIVPTLPIKAGAQSFLTEKYVSQHFADTLGYDAIIELCVVTPMKSKKGKRYFPSSVRSFIGSNASDKIQVLLVNQGLLSGTAKVLSRNDYDTGILDFFRPFDALRATHPFVIIDEPHKFDKGNATFKTIVEQLAPQCIIRYGATFPKCSIGRGKNKVDVDDYSNLLFDLSAKDAFDQNLIKGVIKEHLEIPNASEEKARVMSTSKGKSVNIRHVKGDAVTTHELHPGDSLNRLSPSFAGVSISEIGKDFIMLSTSQEKRVGEEFAVNAFSDSYQEQMIRLALKRHFETERENFDRPIRIKTLALFFIDSIQSFRGDENGYGAWLRDMFDYILAEQIDYELSLPCSDEYADYLLATKADIAAARAGYFAQDSTDSDDAIAKEVEDILHNKKDLLAFYDSEGKWNTRRFLFSKWTLREGWDNPNVFTIAKLRSSGSEISKLQEVGRGLRLPVDELGNRISN
ncbi:MAG: type III restriction-modification system endonuclease, partial [Lachnospiraceae bacterium]|nr:type III restriction-modification system endonuclease [Lachnospiraceae bacterium]